MEAAREAGEPGAEAVAWAWTSLGWTYDSQAPECRRAALHAAQAGRRLCPAASVLGGWLASIEAEVHANEADRSACLAALRDAQRAADLPAAGEAW